MVGDRSPDILAGSSFGLQTAYLGDLASDDYATLAARGVRPSFQGRDLRNFAEFLLGRQSD